MAQQHNSLLGRPLPLHQETGCIYLDYNGVSAKGHDGHYGGYKHHAALAILPQTTPIWPEVADAMRPYLVEHGNPSSAYVYGATCKQAVETARRQVAALINCKPSEVYFTSCGTESDNCGSCNASPTPVCLPLHLRGVGSGSAAQEVCPGALPRSQGRS